MSAYFDGWVFFFIIREKKITEKKKYLEWGFLCAKVGKYEGGVGSMYFFLVFSKWIEEDDPVMLWKGLGVSAL